MVKIHKYNPVPARLLPGLTRIALDAMAPGHPSTSGLQGSASLARQPGQEVDKLLEDNKKHRRIWTREDNYSIMKAYYQSIPSKRGFQKRMYQIWKEKHPDLDINEQRLMDQRRVILKHKFFTDLELQEIIDRAGQDPNSSIDDKAASSQTKKQVVEEEEIKGSTGKEETIASKEFEGPTAKDELVEKIKDQMKMVERVRLPKLNQIDQDNLAKILKKINEAVQSIPTETLAQTNQLMYAAAYVATEELGLKAQKNQGTKKGKPKWKIRLELKIKNIRSDLSNLKNLRQGNLKDRETKNRLITRYDLNNKEIAVTIEELKQRVRAIAEKIKRYDNRILQFHQNSQFRVNQHYFYRSLENGHENTVSEKPNKEDTLKFWKNLWENSNMHNENAKWIKPVENLVKAPKMEDFQITKEMIQEQTMKIKNWSAPGPDELHGFWLKSLTNLHARLANQMNQVLETPKDEQWLTSGKTLLIQKDKEKGNEPGNYRPITCLPTTYKLLTGIIASKIYGHLKDNNLLPVEQKGCCKNSRGTKDQLLIDKLVLKNSKKRRTNLFMAWIDYKKAFDSVPHSWIEKCLDIFGVSNNIQTFMKTSMKLWQVKLVACGEELGEVQIKRGIFQGDSLSPLLFVLSMAPLTTILNRTNCGYELTKKGMKISHLLYMDDLKLFGKTKAELNTLLENTKEFSKDIGMQFGIDKCAAITVKAGKVVKDDGYELDNEEGIKAITSEEGYKYLGILEASDLLHNQVKEATSTKYLKRVRKILQSKLNGGNIIKAINTWAVPVIRYSAGIIDWTQMELDNLDRKTRKLMAMHHALHPKSDIDRLYLPRAEGGRGLLQVKQTVEEEKHSLNDYIKRSAEPMLQEVNKAGLLKTVKKKAEYRKERMESRAANWKNKPMHGQYLKSIEGKADPKLTWRWLRAGVLKKETEGLILAAQEQVLPTNCMKTKIQHVSNNSKCRLCNQKDETVDHLISGCSKITQSDYLQRHDRVAKIIHWKLCQKYGFDCSKNYWEHHVEKVLENEKVKILWDFKIQTDRHLAHNTPDITVMEKKKTWFIDIAIPGDARIEDKQLEKITKYRDLQIEAERLWKKKSVVVPIVIGALGAIPKGLPKYLEILDIPDLDTLTLQKTALLGTAYILRRYLNSS